MRIEATQKASGRGKGFVLFGKRPDTGKWLERWYPTIEKATTFCQKKGFTVTIDEAEIKYQEALVTNVPELDNYIL